MGSYILALDEGTTSARAILFDHNGQIFDMVQKEFPQIYPQSGWVEQDPMEIYASQYGVMMELIAKNGLKPTDIHAIGITNQRETVVIWDRKTGRPYNKNKSGNLFLPVSFSPSVKTNCSFRFYQSSPTVRSAI